MTPTKIISSKKTCGRSIQTLIYPRMLGYLASIMMHITNAVLMHHTFSGDVLQDPDVRRFQEDQYKFITIWNVYLQMLYCALGLSCDVLSLASGGKDNVLLKNLKKIRDPMYSALVFPLGLTVSTIFWAVFSYERSLILPPNVDKTLSWTANHVIHTAIVPVALWDIMFRPRRRPDSHVMNLAIMYSCASAYLIFITTSYIQQDTWVYPILNILDCTIYLYLFLGIAVLLLQIYYCLQWYLTDLIWGSRTDMKKIN